ncbi:hypothetical protein pdam_00017880, partial [Pocillopora damicornis]
SPASFVASHRKNTRDETSRIVNYNFMKNEGCSLFLCESLHACQSLAPLVETKTKKKTLLRLSLASFSHHHYS